MISRNQGRASVPGAPSQRQLRVGEEIRHGLSSILSRGEVRDPDVADTSITITEVDVSPDMRSAVVFVMPLGGERGPEAVAGLTRAASFLRSALGREVRLRFLPSMSFLLDTGFERAGRMDQVMRSPEVSRDLGPDIAPDVDEDD